VLELSGHQRAILLELSAKDQRLGAIYLGTHHVLGQRENPDRLPLAAHGIRELIEKLPLYSRVDVPVAEDSGLKQPPKPPGLTQKVQDLSEHWSRVGTPPKRGDEVSGALQRFLGKIDEFFIWFRQAYATRRDQAAGALRDLDPTGRPLPPPIEKLRIDEWQQCNEFFQGVAHHGKQCSEEDFAAWVDVLEHFLVDRLRPRTFDDHTTLDAIREEGETGA
jgi:hypothetical protein